MKIDSMSTNKIVSKPTSMIKKGKKHIYNKMPWRSPTNYPKDSPKSATLASSVAADPFDPAEASTRSLLAQGKLSDGGLPGAESAEVPKGSVAVYVGPELRRYVIPTSCFSMPDFRVLMDRTAEEYGFESEGALELPCDEEDFKRVLSRCLSKEKKKLGIIKI